MFMKQVIVLCYCEFQSCSSYMLAIASLLNKQIQANNNNNVYIGIMNIQIVTDTDL